MFGVGTWRSGHQADFLHSCSDPVGDPSQKIEAFLVSLNWRVLDKGAPRQRLMIGRADPCCGRGNLKCMLLAVLKMGLATFQPNVCIVPSARPWGVGFKLPLHPRWASSAHDLRGLCLSEIKLAHTDDEVRQEMA